MCCGCCWGGSESESPPPPPPLDLLAALAEGDVDDGCRRPMLAYGAEAVDPKPLEEGDGLGRWRKWYKFLPERGDISVLFGSDTKM